MQKKQTKILASHFFVLNFYVYLKEISDTNILYHFDASMNDVCVKCAHVHMCNEVCVIFD
jgi:hypothetical protein